MRIELYRDVIGPNFTLGKLSIDGVFECYTLEDQDRQMESGGEKVYGRTAISRGMYPVTITPSNRFKKDLPLVGNVPGFSGIRIHAGNTADDTDGCILVGESRADGFIGESRKAMAALQPKIQAAIDAGEEVTLIVR